MLFRLSLFQVSEMRWEELKKKYKNSNTLQILTWRRPERKALLYLNEHLGIIYYPEPESEVEKKNATSKVAWSTNWSEGCWLIL